MIPAKELFASTIMPTPYRVLGQDLLPFSVGHALLFEKLEIEKIDSPQQLILAVLVCCHTYEDYGRKTDRSLLFGLTMRFWFWQCRRALRDPKRYVAAMKTFHDYLQEGTSCPDCELTDRADESESKTPFLQHLKVVLMAKLHYTASEVLDLPYSQAVWDYRSSMELDGALVITDGRAGERAAYFAEDAAIHHEERVKAFTAMHRRN